MCVASRWRFEDMFIGHFALGLAAKRLTPETSLATTLAAAQWPDIVWPVLVLAGVEHVTIAPGDTAFTPLRFDQYPISHSLLTVMLWGAALAGLHFARCRRPRAALLLGALVVSHWLLDFVSHRPDMPLTPWSPDRWGLGLWNSIPGTFLVEGSLFLAGLAIFRTASRPRDRVGRWAFGLLVAFLLVAYLASALGPPPPSVAAVGWTTVAGALLLLPWAAWADRHRTASVASRNSEL